MRMGRGERRGRRIRYSSPQDFVRCKLVEGIVQRVKCLPGSGPAKKRWGR